MSAQSKVVEAEVPLLDRVPLVAVDMPLVAVAMVNVAMVDVLEIHV